MELAGNLVPARIGMLPCQKRHLNPLEGALVKVDEKQSSGLGGLYRDDVVLYLEDGRVCQHATNISDNKH